MEEGQAMTAARLRAAEAELAAAQTASSGVSVADAQAALDAAVAEALAADVAGAERALEAARAQSSGVSVADAQAALDAALN